MAPRHGDRALDSRNQLSRRAAPDFQISQPNSSRFLFVTVDGEEERNRRTRKDRRAGKARSELRSHVMLVTSEGKRRQQMLETLFHHQRMIPSECDAHRADPFNALPIRSTPAIDAAIKFFFNNYTGATPLSDDTLILTPSPPRPPRMSNTLWTLLSTTPASLSLLLYASTTLRDALAASGSFAHLSPECLTYHAWTLQHVRRDLEGLPTGASSAAELEPAVSAVAGLAAVAGGVGLWGDAGRHYEGLKGLVRRAGGVGAFGRFARRTIAWCEFHVIAAVGGVPQLAVEMGMADAAAGWEDRVPEAFVAAVDAGSPLVRGETGEVVRLMRMAAVGMEGRWAKEVEREVVADVLDAAETRLLVEVERTREEGGERVRREGAEGVYVAVTVAAQVFLWGGLAVNPIKFPMSGRWAERLRGVVEGMREGVWEVWERGASLKVLLWVLFMGWAVAEEGTVEWFEERVFVVLRMLDVWGEEELREVLEEFLWVDKLCREPCRMLWKGFELYEDILGVVQGNFMC